MSRLVLSLAIGLVGAAIVHIVTVLGVPRFAQGDVLARAEALGAEARFVVLPGREGTATGPGNAATDGDAAGTAAARGPVGDDPASLATTRDPMLAEAVCLLDLGVPQRVFASGAVPFWSASVFTPEGLNAYSLNDRTAREGALDLIVLSARDAETLRETLSEDAPELVALDAERAVAVLRVLVPDESYAPAARAFLAEAECDALDVDDTGALPPRGGGGPGEGAGGR